MQLMEMTKEGETP